MGDEKGRKGGREEGRREGRRRKEEREGRMGGKLAYYRQSEQENMRYKLRKGCMFPHTHTHTHTHTQVSQAAEDLFTLLAPALPTESAIELLSPMVAQEKYPMLLGTIKLLTKVKTGTT